MNKPIYLFAILGLFIFASCGNQATNETTESSEMEEVEESTAVEGSTDELYGAGQEIREDQKVFFVNLNDGDVISSPFTVEMGVEGMTVEPAGELKKDVGHHHIIINRGAYAVTEVVPMDEMNLHYGKGQTEAELELEPGEYMLTLQFADGLHQSYGPEMSASINIVVE